MQTVNLKNKVMMKPIDETSGISKGISVPLEVLCSLKRLYTEKWKYTIDVMDAAIRLGEEDQPFYCGSIINDYGVYAFLCVEEFHYECKGVVSDGIIIASHVDMYALGEFIECLNVPSSVKEELMDDLTHYEPSEGDTDTHYTRLMEHLIQCFKCLRARCKRIAESR